MRWGGPAEDKARSCSQRCHLIEKQLLLRSIFCSLGSQNKTKNVYLMNTCSFQFVPTKGKSKKKKKRNAIQSLSHSWWVGKKLSAFLLPVFAKCGLFLTEGLNQSSPKNQNICIHKMRNWLTSPWGLRSPEICSRKGGDAGGPIVWFQSLLEGLITRRSHGVSFSLKAGRLKIQEESMF